LARRFALAPAVRPCSRELRRVAISRCSHQLVRVLALRLCRVSAAPPIPPSASTSAATPTIQASPAPPPVARLAPGSWTTGVAGAWLSVAAGLVLGRTRRWRCTVVRCTRCGGGLLGVTAAVGAGAATAGALVGVVGARVMPLPNSWPPPEPPELPPRACWSGIAYSFATGLPGSMWTPGAVGGAAAATAENAARARAAATSVIRERRTLARRAIAWRPPNSLVRDWRSLGDSSLDDPIRPVLDRSSTTVTYPLTRGGSGVFLVNRARSAVGIAHRAR